MKLNECVVVVTGGASGMGAATARYCAEKGAKVAILDFDRERAEVIAKEIGGLAVQCDVSSASSAEAAIDQVVSTYQSIQGLVSCAGIARAARLVSKQGPMSLDDFQQVIQVNLVGTVNVARLVAAHMQTQSPVSPDGERGVMIQTASVAAFEGQIGQVAYSASKGGIVSMTLPLARELAAFGIRVMTIAPGIIATPMMEGMPEKVQASLTQAIPFPSRLGAPEEYARLVEHIFENPYLNGSVIRLDAAIRMAPK